MWSEIVKKEEEVIAGDKTGEKDKPDNQETLSGLRVAMTQWLAQREQIQLIEDIDSPFLDADVMELGTDREERDDGEDTELEGREEVGEREKERGKKKRERKERPGVGMSAGKRQRLSQDQDENLLRPLEAQDEKAGKLYKETLTVTGTDTM